MVKCLLGIAEYGPFVLWDRIVIFVVLGFAPFGDSRMRAVALSSVFGVAFGGKLRRNRLRERFRFMMFVRSFALSVSHWICSLKHETAVGRSFGLLLNLAITAGGRALVFALASVYSCVLLSGSAKCWMIACESIGVFVIEFGSML